MDTDSQWALKMEGMARGRVCREPIFLAEPFSKSLISCWKKLFWSEYKN
jgi:hypothetical protein